MYEYTEKNEWLHTPVCHTPVPDIIHNHFTGFVQHPVDYPVLPYPDPILRFCTGQFNRIMRDEDLSKGSLRAQKCLGAGLLEFSGNLSPRCF